MVEKEKEKEKKKDWTKMKMFSPLSYLANTFGFHIIDVARNGRCETALSLDNVSPQVVSPVDVQKKILVVARQTGESRAGRQRGLGPQPVPILRV